MDLSLERGWIPVLDLDSDPWGHGAFAFGFLVLPGLIWRGPSGRQPAIGPVDEHCLITHELGHWQDWALVTAILWAFLYLTGQPWWTYIPAAFVYQALVLPLAVWTEWPPGVWIESRWDRRQSECEDRRRSG